MYKEVVKWVNSLGIPIADSYLRMRLESHPDYPSLTAVQDTLEELGIEANAWQTSKQSLQESGKPFLAHLNIGEGYIYYFSDLAAAEKKIKDFDAQWSGVVMLAEKTGIYDNPDHDKLFRQEKQNRFFASTAILAILSLFAAAVAYSNAVSGILFLTSIAGVYFNWLITQKEFGISNSVSDKICSMARHSRCESVLFSKGARLFSWLSWGDVGMVYFTGSIFYLAVSLLLAGEVSNQFYYLLSAAGSLFPLYSVYYQWKVVKQWCMLCLVVVLLLLLNGAAGVLLIQRPVQWNREMLTAALLFTAIVVLCLAGWQLFKYVYQQSLLALDNNIKAMRLKRSPDIFNALLQQQELRSVNLPQPDEAIRFGNPAAPYQLVIACNPYCGPCAKAHQAVGELYKKYPEQLAVTVRFAIYSNDENDGKVAAVKEILKAAKANPYEAVKDWYHIYNLEKFKQAYQPNGINVEKEIQNHVEWNKKVDIKGTPTFFINGKLLPEIYNWIDFIEIVKFDIKD